MLLFVLILKNLPVIVSASRVLAEVAILLLRGNLSDCSVALALEDIFKEAADERAAVVSVRIGPTSSTAASLDDVATRNIASPS